jgi:hypothetical protein
MLVVGKKCWVGSVKKMATPESVPRGGRFSAFGSIIAGNDTVACSDPCAPGGDY